MNDGKPGFVEVPQDQDGHSLCGKSIHQLAGSSHAHPFGGHDRDVVAVCDLAAFEQVIKPFLLYEQHEPVAIHRPIRRADDRNADGRGAIGHRWQKARNVSSYFHRPEVDPMAGVRFDEATAGIEDDIPIRRQLRVRSMKPGSSFWVK